MADGFFKNRKMNERRLLASGFSREDDDFVRTSVLLDGLFELTVVISAEGRIKTRVIDVSTREEYILYKISDAVGAFVGKVREAYENSLAEIAEKCFDRDVFKSSDAKKVIRYLADKYDDHPEFLWEKFSENAIFRRKDNAKWYAALLTVQKWKLGLDGEERIEIIDLRIEPAELPSLVDGITYFPGYHMNKKHWFTICLDGSVPVKEIFDRIDVSYAIARKR